MDLGGAERCEMRKKRGVVWWAMDGGLRGFGGFEGAMVVVELARICCWIT